MKRLLNFAFFALAGVLFSGCKIDKTDYVVFDDETLFHPTAAIIDDLNQEIPINPLTPYMDEPETKGSSVTINTVAKNLIALIGGGAVESLVGTYMSTDKDGNPIRLSGRVILPSSGDIKNIILVSHFTITANYECPSNSFQLEGILALDGYALVIPDYIGYGITCNMTHPYLITEVTARNVVDMLDATVPYLKKIGRAPVDDSIILMGYSQGGAATIAVQRYLENNAVRYGQKYKIKRNYAGAGPYDIATTYDTCIEMNETSIPCAIPMIVMGMDEGENLGLDYSLFFKEPLLSNYEEWILSKKYTTKQLGTLMGTRYLSDIMTSSAMQKRERTTVDFYNAMLKNCAYSNWTPQAPIYMFHSIDDDTVPYINTIMFQNDLPDANVEFNIGHYGNHVMGCLKFLLCVREML